MNKTLIACAVALSAAFTVTATEPEMPAWAVGTIPKAEAYEKNQADKEYTEKVRPNVPAEAIIKPAKPRKLLVFHNPRNYRHTAEVLLRRAVVEVEGQTALRLPVGGDQKQHAWVRLAGVSFTDGTITFQMRDEKAGS